MKRYNCTLSDKRGAFGLCMEERKEGAFVPFSEISGLAEQLADATRQCGVMANLLREAKGFVVQVFDSDINYWSDNPLLLNIDAALAGKLPAKPVTITETIRTAPDRIWLQVGDQSHYHSEPFPEHHDEVTWCADSVVACEVPYVRADLAAAIPAPVVPEGWKIVPLEPEGEQWGGLARAIIFWMRSYQSNEHTPATLEDFITRLGNTIPDWMKKESEFGDKGHVISKGTAAAFIYKAMLADAPKPPIVKLARFITEGQELELITVLQSIVNGFSDDPAHDAAALLKRITGEVQWTGDSFQLPSRQGGEPCAIEPRSSSPA